MLAFSWRSGRRKARMSPRVEIREATERDMDEIRRVSLAAQAEYAEMLEPDAWEQLESGSRASPNSPRQARSSLRRSLRTGSSWARSRTSRPVPRAWGASQSGHRTESASDSGSATSASRSVSMCSTRRPAGNRRRGEIVGWLMGMPSIGAGRGPIVCWQRPTRQAPGKRQNPEATMVQLPKACPPVKEAALLAYTGPVV